MRIIGSLFSGTDCFRVRVLRCPQFFQSVVGFLVGLIGAQQSLLGACNACVIQHSIRYELVIFRLALVQGGPGAFQLGRKFIHVTGGKRLPLLNGLPFFHKNRVKHGSLWQSYGLYTSSCDRAGRLNALTNGSCTCLPGCDNRPDGAAGSPGYQRQDQHDGKEYGNSFERPPVIALLVGIIFRRGKLAQSGKTVSEE